MRRQGLRAALAFLMTASCPAAWAATPGLQGQSLEEAIRQLEADGLVIVYSSSLVTPRLRVLEQPAASQPEAVLREILLPHGLDVAEGPNGSLMVVRGAAPAKAPHERDASRQGELTEIFVTASRYRLELRPMSGARAMTAQDLELLPELADDPVRAVARLPGVTRQDFSSEPIIRGGVADETLVRFDGLRLYEPYHLKDFQNLASAIDANIVDGMTIFTASFPVEYGDRLSGVVDILPVRPGERFGGRIAASLFNLSALLGGPLNDGAGDWIAAVRRGNLDLVLDVANPDLGQPNYGDAYARISHDVGQGLRVSANLLVSDDDLRVFDSDQEEQATAEYRDEYYWLNLDMGDVDSAGGRLQYAYSRLSSDRRGAANLPGVGSGRLDDQRHFSIHTLAAEAWRRLGDAAHLSGGIEWRSVEGRYEYADQAQFDLLFLTPGADTVPTRERQLSVDASGSHFAAFVNGKLELGATLTADLGLRWDRETLSSGGSGRLGPRLGLLWRPRAGTLLRAGWGQFFQAQGVNELAVSDGDPRFYAGQRAEHWVISGEQELPYGLNVRIEGYRKDYDDLRPRHENLLNSLVVLPELKPDRLTVTPGSAYAEGLEISLGYEDGPWKAWFGYGWGRVRDRLGGVSVPRGWDQTHSYGAGTSYQGDRWELTLTGLWHTGWPTTRVELATLEPFPLVSTGVRNADRIGDYLRFDARVARNVPLESGGLLSLYVEVSNVSNRRNDCCVEYQLETENPPTFLDVAAVESLPIVPSIGFVWSF